MSRSSCSGEEEAGPDGAVGLDGSARTEAATPASAGAPSEPPSTETLAPGTTIGRWIVREWIGAGGMGVVYRAYDPALARTVALKLLHRERMSPRGEARLLREAQAMAQLSHPNVVTIYGVEHSEHGTVLVMEYVPGQPLSRWIRERPGWRRIVEVMIDAGEGLRAAHEAGLIHRDFKPSNVLLAKDGRAQVVDFGLVRVDESSSPPREDELTLGESGAPDPGPSDIHTVAGRMVGTVAYMAPEQMESSDVGERSDQYAFCVSLWEALCGERPFGGAPMEVLRTKLRSRWHWPADVDVPPRLVDAVERGLSPRAADRWPSMAALLDELRATVAPERSRWLPRVVVAGLAVLGSIAWVLAAEPWASDDAQCSEFASSVGRAWDGPRKDAVRAAMDRAGAGHARHTWPRVERHLDEHAAAWASAHQEACLATHVRAEVTVTELDRRFACLRQARAELDAITDALSDPASARRASTLVRSLDDPGECLVDTPLFDMRPAGDPRLDEVMPGSRAELARVHAMMKVGAFEEALERLEPLVARARALEDARVLAEVLFARGQVFSRARRIEFAERDLDEAYGLAEGAGRTRLAVDAAYDLAMVLGSHQGRHEEALRWSNTAVALALRNHARTRLEVMTREAVAIALFRQGRYHDAAQTQERVLALQDELADTEPLDRARSASTMANILQEIDQPERGAALLRRALEIQERELGPDHLTVSSSLNNLATTLVQEQRFTEAIPLLRRALAIRERVLGPEHPRLVSTLNNLGLCYLELGRLARAQTIFERQRALIEDAYEEEHHTLGSALLNLGGVYSEQGDPERAAELIRHSVESWERTLGPEHPKVALALVAEAELQANQGQLEDARRRFARALEIRERSLGDDHPLTIDSMLRLAEVELRSGPSADGRARARLGLERFTQVREPSAELSALAERVRAAVRAPGSGVVAGTRQ